MKDPAFNFYSDNFLSGTMFFSDEQTGKYIRLLCAQHLTGHLKENHMIFICKSYDKEIWDKFQKDDDGFYFNERLEIEVNKRKLYSESRSNNKKGKMLKPKIISKSYDYHMGIGIGIGIGNISSSFSSPEFIKIWNELVEIPKWKKKPLSAIQKSLKQLEKFEESFAIGLIEKAIAGNYQGVCFSNTEIEYSNWKQNSNGKTFKNNGKMAGTYKAAEDLAAEVREKSKRFEERMQNTG